MSSQVTYLHGRPDGRCCRVNAARHHAGCVATRDHHHTKHIDVVCERVARRLRCYVLATPGFQQKRDIVVHACKGLHRKADK
jgi:hypothetical protein